MTIRQNVKRQFGLKNIKVQLQNQKRSAGDTGGKMKHTQTIGTKGMLKSCERVAFD